MFISGSNVREAADLKDVIATGKRSQVTRLVFGPLLVMNKDFRDSNPVK